jgi:hypothetical protein
MTRGRRWFCPRSDLEVEEREEEMLFELFVVTMAVNLKTLVSKPFVMIWVSNISFLLPMWPVKMM